MEKALYADELIAPLAVRSPRGGTRPGAIWVAAAILDYRCEGLNPFASNGDQRFARDHEGTIRKGSRFLRKVWQTFERYEFTSRHCEGCGRLVESIAGTIRC